MLSSVNRRMKRSRTNVPMLQNQMHRQRSQFPPFEVTTANLELAISSVYYWKHWYVFIDITTTSFIVYLCPKPLNCIAFHVFFPHQGHVAMTVFVGRVLIGVPAGGLLAWLVTILICVHICFTVQHTHYSAICDLRGISWLLFFSEKK